MTDQQQTEKPSLTRDTRCAVCGGMMKAGDAFRWFEKSGFRGGSRSRGLPARWLPAHVEICGLSKTLSDDAAKQKQRDAEIEAQVAENTRLLAAGEIDVSEFMKRLGA